MSKVQFNKLMISGTAVFVFAVMAVFILAEIARTPDISSDALMIDLRNEVVQYFEDDDDFVFSMNQGDQNSTYVTIDYNSRKNTFQYQLHQWKAESVNELVVDATIALMDHILRGENDYDIQVIGGGQSHGGMSLEVLNVGNNIEFTIKNRDATWTIGIAIEMVS